MLYLAFIYASPYYTSRLHIPPFLERTQNTIGVSNNKIQVKAPPPPPLPPPPQKKKKTKTSVALGKLKFGMPDPKYSRMVNFKGKQTIYVDCTTRSSGGTSLVYKAICGYVLPLQNIGFESFWSVTSVLNLSEYRLCSFFLK